MARDFFGERWQALSLAEPNAFVQQFRIDCAAAMAVDHRDLPGAAFVETVDSSIDLFSQQAFAFVVVPSFRDAPVLEVEYTRHAFDIGHDHQFHDMQTLRPQT